VSGNTAEGIEKVNSVKDYTENIHQSDKLLSYLILLELIVILFSSKNLDYILCVLWLFFLFFSLFYDIKKPHKNSCIGQNPTPVDDYGLKSTFSRDFGE
jgi:hypothetical protein